MVNFGAQSAFNCDNSDSTEFTDHNLIVTQDSALKKNISISEISTAVLQTRALLSAKSSFFGPITFTMTVIITLNI